MIYTSLRILPMVLFDEILSSGNYLLLSTEPNLTDLDKEQLKLLWDELNEQYQEKYNKASKNKYFNVDKEVAYQSGRYAVINSICDSLLFAKEQRLIDILIEEGYRIRESNYIEDIERAKKQAHGIIIKINTLIDSLPKKDPNKTTESEYTIIDIMAGYVAVLGFDFDFYTISVEKFKSFEKTVQNKLKAMEKSKPTKKK